MDEGHVFETDAGRRRETEIIGIIGAEIHLTKVAQDERERPKHPILGIGVPTFRMMPQLNRIMTTIHAVRHLS